MNDQNQISFQVTDYPHLEDNRLSVCKWYGVGILQQQTLAAVKLTARSIN